MFIEDSDRVHEVCFICAILQKSVEKRASLWTLELESMPKARRIQIRNHEPNPVYAFLCNWTTVDVVEKSMHMYLF